MSCIYGKKIKLLLKKVKTLEESGSQGGGQNYVTVQATSQTTAVTDVLPATGSADTIYRVGNWDGILYTVTSYSEYAWDGMQYQFLCKKSQLDEVFDITVYNSNTKYANLTAALGTNGANVPQELRRGGMSVKYVQSSDNKYVQYRLMSDTFNTTVADWQGIDDEPTAGSDNLVKSGGVYKDLYGLTETHYTEGGYIKSDGTVVSNGNYSYSEYIPISAGQNIHLDYGTIAINLVVVVYNVGRRKVDYWSLTTSSTTKDFTAPANSAYMRFAWTKGYNAKAYSNNVLFWQATVHIDGISDRIDALEDRLDDVSSGLTGLEGKVDNIAVDNATVDYGLLAGYTANRTSGPDIVITDTDTGIHLTKSESSNANYRFDLTHAPKTLLRIKYKSDKNLPNTINVYVDGSSVAVENIPANTKEYEFTYNFESGSVFALGYTMYYDISSVDLDIQCFDANASGLKVIADNISDRVKELEESAQTPIPASIEGTNTFIGDGAGQINTPIEGSDNGNYNTAVGKNAMRYNTLGDHCTALGFCALNKNQDGRNNTALGEDAMYENLHGGQNVAIGQHSGQDSQGGYNVFIGSNVARRMASGDLNVIIGAEAYNDYDQLGGSNMVLIGAYVRNSGNYNGVISISGEEPTAAKEIRIGKADFSAFIIGNKKLNFNQDGTVTWEDVTPTP